MDKLIELVIQLEAEVKRKEREIDNPVLTLSLLSELELFKESIETKKDHRTNGSLLSNETD